MASHKGKKGKVRKLKKVETIIPIDMGKVNEEYRLNYNILGFMAPVMIDIIDKLEGSTEYKHRLKMHLNGALPELEAINLKQYNIYEKHGLIDNKGKDIDSLDVYIITLKAYSSIFTRSPREIVSIVERVRRMEEEGIVINDIGIDFTPTKK